MSDPERTNPRAVRLQSRKGMGSRWRVIRFHVHMRRKASDDDPPGQSAPLAFPASVLPTSEVKEPTTPEPTRAGAEEAPVTASNQAVVPLGAFSGRTLPRWYALRLNLNLVRSVGAAPVGLSAQDLPAGEVSRGA